MKIFGVSDRYKNTTDWALISKSSHKSLETLLAFGPFHRMGAICFHNASKKTISVFGKDCI